VRHVPSRKKYTINLLFTDLLMANGIAPRPPPIDRDLKPEQPKHPASDGEESAADAEIADLKVRLSQA
jgi:hypothetical protein